MNLWNVTKKIMEFLICAALLMNIPTTSSAEMACTNGYIAYPDGLRGFYCVNMSGVVMWISSCEVLHRAYPLSVHATDCFSKDSLVSYSRNCVYPPMIKKTVTYK